MTTRDPTTGFTTFAYTNVSSASISGLEANVIKTFDNGINLHTSLAYTYGRNDDTQERLRSVAPFKAIVGGGWSNDEYGFDLSSTLSSQMTGNDNALTSFDAPGYGIVDLTAWWTPEQVKGLRIQGGDLQHLRSGVLQRARCSRGQSECNRFAAEGVVFGAGPYLQDLRYQDLLIDNQPVQGWGRAAFGPPFFVGQWPLALGFISG